MSKHFRRNCSTLLAALTALLAAAPTSAAWGPLNKDYGGNLQMELYTPSQPAASPAVLVALHYCSGHSSNAHGWFDAAADKNGFYIIAPDAGSGNTCFDASLGRSGERADIVKMVEWVITQKKADKTRVFAAGFSSGGCMTNTLLAIYPDVFAGGSAMPGVAAGGWPAGKSCPCNAGMWATQQNPTDGKFWGDKARSVFQFNGTRPCVQQWVGSNDEYGFAGWLPTVAAQFQNLGGLGSGSAGSGAPSGWNRTVYKDSAGNVRLETNTKSGQAHNLIGAVPTDQVIKFLGLDQPSGACGVTTPGSGGAASGGAGGRLGDGGAAASTTGGSGARGGSTGSTGGSSSSMGGSTASMGGSSAGGTTPTSGGAAFSNGGTLALSGGSSNTSGGDSSNGVGGASSPAGGSPSPTQGGSTAQGGASNAAAGNPNSAGQSTGADGNSEPGCSCSALGARRQNLGFVGVASLVLGLGIVNRQRKRRRPQSEQAG